MDLTKQSNSSKNKYKIVIISKAKPIVQDIYPELKMKWDKYPNNSYQPYKETNRILFFLFECRLGTSRFYAGYESCIT